MNTARAALLLVLSGLVRGGAGVLPLAAQDLSEVRLDRAGTTVRIYRSDDDPTPLEGSVVRLRNDEVLVVRSPESVEVEVPRDDIRRLEFSTGRHGHPWWGTVIGAFAAGIPGAIYWNRECEGSCDYRVLEGFALGALYFGVVPGFVIGSLVRTRNWRPLPLVYLDSAVGGGTPGRLQPYVGPSPTGGIALGLRLSLSPSRTGRSGR